MNVIEEIRRDAGAAPLLWDWIGQGDPVKQEVADGRAAVCLRGDEGRRCPYLKAPRWWERYFKNPIAKVIKKQLELKTKLRLSTELDQEKRMCQVCGCCAELKVWVPVRHV